jgi:hypothetical protein
MLTAIHAIVDYKAFVILAFLLTSLNLHAQPVDTSNGATSASSTLDESVPDPQINFYGAGNIQKTLQSGAEIPASTGIGVNYQQGYSTSELIYGFIKNLEVDALIKVA